MKEQQIPPNIRINNAIDQDIRDAKINLNLIEKVTDPSDLPQTLVFSSEELQTLMRNCVHAVILNLTKTIEKPIIHEERIQTYNLESLIDSICHHDDINSLKNEVQRIRGNKIYGKLIEYRHKIIAHRNVEYGEYQAIEQEFTECKDYLLKHKGQIEKLIDKINDLQMNIKDSRLKKRGFPPGAYDMFTLHVKVSKC